MRKGVIMEVQPRHWILLTPDGEFVRVPRTNMALTVGEEVEFHMVEKSSSAWKRKPWIAAISAGVAAMIGMFFVLPQMSPSKQVHAEGYIYLDVNPSVAIGMDKNKYITEVKPLNKSALKLIGNKTYKNKQVDDFVEHFLDEAKQQGFLHPKDQVVLSGYNDEKTSVKTLQEIENMIDEESKEEKLELHVHTLTMPKSVKKKADETGLSPAKYAVWMIANKEGKNLDVKEMEEIPITQLAEDIKPISDFLNRPPSEKEWESIIEEESQPKTNDKDDAPAKKTDTNSNDSSSDSTQDPTPDSEKDSKNDDPAHKEEPDQTDSQPPLKDQDQKSSDEKTDSSSDSKASSPKESNIVEDD